MGHCEALDYVEGMRRRPRDTYEAAGILMKVLHKILTGKPLNWDWPWEREQLDDEDQELTLEEARAAARRAEAMMGELMQRRADKRKADEEAAEREAAGVEEQHKNEGAEEQC